TNSKAFFSPFLPYAVCRRASALPSRRTFSTNKFDSENHHKQRRKLREPIPFVTDVKEVKDPCEALALFENYHEKGFKHHYPSYSSLIYKLARSRRFEAVETILGHLRNRNIRCNETLFVALIQHYGKAHLVEKGIELFHQMPSFNCFRTLQSFNVLLNTLVDCDQFSKASEIFQQAYEMGFRPNSVSYNIMIKGWIKKGGWEQACNLFDEMLEKGVQPSVVTYNSFLGVLCRKGEMDTALCLFKNMTEKGHHPNAVTYALLMEGWCFIGKYKEAKKLMFDMEFHGCKLRPVNYGVLMTYLGKAGNIDEMESLLNEMKKRRLKPDVVTYNILVNYLCKEGRVGDAYKVLVKMQVGGCDPNAATYRMMIDGYCNAGDFDGAMKILNAMLMSGHCPHMKTFAFLVVGLLKGENNDDYVCFVLEEMEKRQLRFDAETWRTLIMDVCGQHVEIGRGNETLQDENEAQSAQMKFISKLMAGHTKSNHEAVSMPQEASTRARVKRSRRTSMVKSCNLSFKIYLGHRHC
ncbi:pentatricopeptide repeat-containing protein At1g07740, mitochondrial, partial [Cucumis melo]|uniref:Pentatricopeptide repeat-containing protein At1g07740, mitochondrial n=1 Tax=Cucumis melo TaxID=3656 RepID=A0ABM3KHH4_CUCME